MMKFNTELFGSLLKNEEPEKRVFTPAEIIRKRHLDKKKSKTRAANKHGVQQRKAQRKAL